MEIKNLEHGSAITDLIVFDENSSYIASPLYSPPNIELSLAQHGLLNGIRYATAEDGIERFAFIWEKENKFFASGFVKGKRTCVPSEVINREIQKGNKNNFTGGAIDIHSHPATYLPEALGFLWPLIKKSGIKDSTAFSTGDLYRLVIKDGISNSMVVAEDKNLFVIKTKESNNYSIPRAKLTQLQFGIYWHNPFRIYKNTRFIDEKRSKLWQILKNPLALNFAIAEEYKLAVYQGGINEDLTRIYPPLPPRSE